jgi:hypothetical protein
MKMWFSVQELPIYSLRNDFLLSLRPVQFREQKWPAYALLYSDGPGKALCLTHCTSQRSSPIHSFRNTSLTALTTYVSVQVLLFSLIITYLLSKKRVFKDI